MKYKLKRDSRVELTDEEKREFLKTPCPICGVVHEPYMYDDWFVKTTYYYKCFDTYTNTDIESIVKKLPIETIPGCNSEWTIKINPKKDFYRGTKPTFKDKITKVYLKVLKLIVRWCKELD